MAAIRKLAIAIVKIVSGVFSVFRLWQVIVMLVVLGGGAGITYSAYTLLTGSDPEELEANQQVITVKYGDLISQISTNGNLSFPNKEYLRFGTSGIVQSILVREGSMVTKGDTIAKLDSATLASIDKDIAQARVNLRNARDLLSDFLAGPTDSTREAKEKAVKSANSRLDIAIGALVLAEMEWTPKLVDAPELVEASREEYKTAIAKWLGLGITDDQASQSIEQILSILGTSLDKLFEAESSKDSLLAGKAVLDDASTGWNESIINSWVHFYPGNLVIMCKTFTPSSDSFCVEKELNDPWKAHTAAIDEFTKLKLQYSNIISKANLDIDVSRETLRLAKEVLELLDEKGDPLDLAFLEANLASSEETLSSLTDLKKDINIVSPITGIISVLSAEVGQTVNPNSIIATVVDQKEIEISAVVDEIDVLYVKVGAPVQVTMDALTSQVLKGTVKSIEAEARTTQGIVSYPIIITVTPPDNIQLVEGLSATATIVTREDKNVLLVPIQALRGTFDEPIVHLKDEGEIIQQFVTLGTNDDIWVVIKSGLKEGDLIIMETESVSTQTSGFRFGGGSFRGLGGQSGR